MQKTITFILFFIFCPDIAFSDLQNRECIVGGDRDIIRNQFTYHETIQSDNFVVHFTTSDVDSQLVNGQWLNLQCNMGYAESVLENAESSLEIFLEDGWENIPPDCDESILDLDSPHHCINFGGNSLYDIYLSNDGVGMVVPETPYPVEPYTGGYTSYMKISTLLNQHETLPSWNLHVIAHELHHSIQLRYGYSVSGSVGNYMYNGWFFEQSATYMEEVIYPNSFHLLTMLGNCNVVTPLTFPHYNIDYPAEIYPYRSALWQKFLVESLGDPSIIRYMWEDYGLNYATGETVSLFPIYNDAIQYVTNQQSELSDAYAEYAIWRYFTGERSISNEYFSQSASYCEALTIPDFEGSFILPSNKGASHFINLPSDDLGLIISTDYPNDIQFSYLKIDQYGNIDIESLSHNGNLFYFDVSSNTDNVLIANSNYNNIISNDITFSISIAQSDIMGDVNGDFSVNVQDVVITVNMALTSEYNYLVDFNLDNSIDILDVVQLINIILN